MLGRKRPRLLRPCLVCSERATGPSRSVPLRVLPSAPRHARAQAPRPLRAKYFPTFAAVVQTADYFFFGYVTELDVLH